ncbi:cupin domain-containing protein [Mucilaginibacter sp. KACC 22773]|uniref:JmjC domain-containing protein n=1 Tax=Mucilaginibacter sp. KACC 22773 TaxID=3025671 RepID=UPI0023653F03|nr:cupin domain-containing protein [Mucilaginibacter sp. KACC 22773]WDF77696.1 cupin domain-containing protein [Mucilaginibacter sp. KACC 22773]
MTVLEKILHPLEKEHFLENYHNKKVLFIKGEQEKFKDFFSFGDLNYFLNTHASCVQFPEIRMSIDGKILDPGLYQETISYYSNDSYEKTKIDPQKVSDLINKKASLIISGIQEYNLNIQSFAHQLSEELHSDIDITLFYNAINQLSFDIHYDPVAVFTVQLEGQKKWQVFKSGDNSQDKESLQPETEYVLNKGDILYIPSGIWHKANPETNNSLSMSIAVRNNNVLDLIVCILESYVHPELLKNESYYITMPRNPEALTQLKMQIKNDLIKCIENLDDRQFSATIATLNRENKIKKGNSTYHIPFDLGN